MPTVALTINSRPSQYVYELRMTIRGLPGDVVQFSYLFNRDSFERNPGEIFYRTKSNLSREMERIVMGRFRDIGLHGFHGQTIEYCLNQLQKSLDEQIERLFMASITDWARAYGNSVDDIMLRHTFTMPQERQKEEKLTMFSDMGREPLVKEILGEVKMLSPDEQKNRISALVEKIK